MHLHNTFFVSWKMYIKSSCLLFYIFCCLHLLASCLLPYLCIYGCIILANIHDIVAMIHIFLWNVRTSHFISQSCKSFCCSKTFCWKWWGFFHLHFYNKVVGFLDNILNYLFCFPNSIFSNLLQYVLLTNDWEM